MNIPSQEQLSCFMKQHEFDPETMLLTVSSYLDELAAFWQTPSVPGSCPRTLEQFLAEVSRQYQEILSQEHSSFSAAETDDKLAPLPHVAEVEVTRGAGFARSPLPEPSTSPPEAAGPPTFLAEYRLSPEQQTVVTNVLGRPCDDAYNTQHLGFTVTFSGTSYQARVRILSGYKGWAQLDLIDSNSNSLNRLPPKYDRLDGSHTFRHNGAEYVLRLSVS